MMNAKNFSKLLLFGLFMGLVACKQVNFNNGQVPDKYLDQAKKLAGTYAGQFNGRAGKLIVAFEGNTPYLTFEGQRSKDILDGRCDSQFGFLKSAYIKNNNTLASVDFAFNPNNCVSIKGDAITLSFNSSYSVIKAQILSSQELEKKCDYEFGGPGGGMREICTYEPVSRYLYGKFIKQ